MVWTPVAEHLVQAAGAFHAWPAIARIYIAVLWAPCGMALCCGLRLSCTAWQAPHDFVLIRSTKKAGFLA